MTVIRGHKRKGLFMPFTKQETYDKVVGHMRKQGVQSLDESGACVYLAKDGKMCAAGCLIPAEDYDPEFEEHQVTEHAGLSDLMCRLGHNLDLVLALQKVHDHYRGPGVWELYFRSVAEHFDLQYTPPEVPA